MFVINTIKLIAIITPLSAIDYDDWTHHSWLDPHEKYLLRWKSNDIEQTISFVAEVRTRGWIGFGISSSGGMKDSDIVIGWVSDDGVHTYFHDRYSTDETTPIVDDSQDWNLLYSAQNETHTVLAFSRPYLTCDDLNDIEITGDTMRLIYAYSDNDPNNIDDIQMHNYNQRGTRSALLLTNENIKEPNEDDLQFTDFVVNNITIPSNATTYWCKLFKVKFAQTRHVIKYLPNITPGNEELTHHFLLFTCEHPDSHKLDTYLNSDGVDCTNSANMPPELWNCFKPYFVWAVGGQPFIAPPEAGFPIGSDDETTYFLLQSHYNNPENIKHRIDSSGLRAYHTSKLRPNEAFTLIAGSVNDYGLVIPPKQKHFTITGHCNTDCFKDLMPKTGLKLFASLPHAHYIGRQIKTRHFRGNTELPWISYDRNFDFNYQQFRSLKSQVTVLEGDLITTECTYDSTSRDYATLGGEATSAEMCLTFLSYYPRMRNNSQMCLSSMTASTVMAISGVDTIVGYTAEDDPIIRIPQTQQNMSLTQYLSSKTDWNLELIRNSQNLIQEAKQRPTCDWIITSNYYENDDQLVRYPNDYSIYSPPFKKCKQNTLQESVVLNRCISIFNFNLINIIIIFVFTLFLI